MTVGLSQPAPGLACGCRRTDIGRGHGCVSRFQDGTSTAIIKLYLKLTVTKDVHVYFAQTLIKNENYNTKIDFPAKTFSPRRNENVFQLTTK